MVAKRKNTPSSAALATSISSTPPLCSFLWQPSWLACRVPCWHAWQVQCQPLLGEHLADTRVRLASNHKFLASESGHAIVLIGHEEGSEATGLPCRAHRTYSVQGQCDLRRFDRQQVEVQFGQHCLFARVVPANSCSAPSESSTSAKRHSSGGRCVQ